GMMPSYGLVSRYGVVAMGSSFDTIGVLGNNVEDAGLFFDITAGKDPMDATTVERAPSYDLANLDRSLKGKKIGIIKEYMAEGIDSGVKQTILGTVELMKKAGAEVTEISMPLADLALPCYYVLVPAEVSSNLARYDGIRFGHSSTKAQTLQESYLLSRNEGFGVEAKRRILIGTYLLSSGYYDAYYKKAQKVRTLIIDDFKQAFTKVDLLVGPAAPMPAFKLGERSKNPVQMYLADFCTVAVNLAGSCGISVPAGMVDGLPVGLQMIGPQQGETALLGAARAVEVLLAEAVL
ncbi:MAG TPA: amidase family protein, partial [Candidatus Polarisedimenticolaceae bacterium]|nr:amidase family protein [Candidatus Polarisedimenticolaceae bacterium]